VFVVRGGATQTVCVARRVRIECEEGCGHPWMHMQTKHFALIGTYQH
jgi:hypothetical protein